MYSSINATSGHNVGLSDFKRFLNSGSPGYAITFFLSVGVVFLISGQGNIDSCLTSLFLSVSKINFFN